MTRYVARPRTWLEPSYSDGQMNAATLLSIMVIDERAHCLVFHVNRRQQQTGQRVGGHFVRPACTTITGTSWWLSTTQWPGLSREKIG